MNQVNRYYHRTFLFITLCLVIAGGMAGCTFKHVKPEFATAPPQKYAIVAVGDIVMEDKLWDYLIPHFKRGLVNGLVELKAFEKVLDSAPESLPPESAILLSGKIYEVNKGSTALRWIVGFGAGKASVKGVFEISGCDGKKLTRFDVGRSYAGGAGLGGANYLDIEDLMQKLGRTVAAQIVHWSKGEKANE